MKENPLQYRVRGTPVPTTQTRGTNYPKSTTEYIPLPEDLEIDRIIVEVNKPGDVDGDKSEFAVN